MKVIKGMCNRFGCKFECRAVSDGDDTNIEDVNCPSQLAQKVASCSPGLEL